ncbi:MAG TPA: hypothetical protein VGM32_07780 [Rhodopila sp.]
MLYKIVITRCTHHECGDAQSHAEHDRGQNCISPSTNTGRQDHDAGRYGHQPTRSGKQRQMNTKSFPAAQI